MRITFGTWRTCERGAILSQHVVTLRIVGLQPWQNGVPKHLIVGLLADFLMGDQLRYYIADRNRNRRKKCNPINLYKMTYQLISLKST
uniref:Uncharacterized protein n=1 Tax=Lepeophtheirus salmonis TaxID=72036 RepID=A0A0K2UGC0_LEPSM